VTHAPVNGWFTTGAAARGRAGHSDAVRGAVTPSIGLFVDRAALALGLLMTPLMRTLTTTLALALFSGACDQALNLAEDAPERDTAQTTGALAVDEPREPTKADERLLQCLVATTGTLQVSPPSVPIDGTVTVTYAAFPPSTSNCAGIAFSVDGRVVGTRGSYTTQPGWSKTLTLSAKLETWTATVATASVQVILPKDPTNPNRNLLTVKTGNTIGLFRQALGTPNTTVAVADSVQMDLSSSPWIAIASGVILRGGRGGLVPGPRLFTRARHPVLFNVWGDNVRITGVRIEGPDMDAVDRFGNVGIKIDSNLGVELDHNELSGFSKAAIDINDYGNRMPPAAPYQVRVHDNYIHHNQATDGDGYGVASSHGAFPLIEANVFDWNRHAIAAGGQEGTGYAAIGNLVLENGGRHRVAGLWGHTHQIDMHGSDTCGVGDIFSDVLYNCGRAGHTMLVHRNTVFYTEDHAIKLRGTPTVGMFIGGNMFPNSPTVNDRYVQVLTADGVTLQLERGVWAQTETGVVIEAGNEAGKGVDKLAHVCDFDGDGVADTFMATGATWWYASGGQMPWTYLHASTARQAELTFGAFDADPRCDIKLGGVVYSGGKPSLLTTTAPKAAAATQPVVPPIGTAAP
jgi:hypothetical protein